MFRCLDNKMFKFMLLILKHGAPFFDLLFHIFIGITEGTIKIAYCPYLA